MSKYKRAFKILEKKLNIKVYSTLCQYQKDVVYTINNNDSNYITKKEYKIIHKCLDKKKGGRIIWKR